MAPRARSRGRVSIRFGRYFKYFRDFTHPRRIKLKGGVAGVANVVVTALRLAGIEHIAGTAVRADHRDGKKRH
jgi:hypothetical protein